MLAGPLRHMPGPCDRTKKAGACPFRRDAEPGEFPASHFEQLADTAGQPGAEVPIGGRTFGCHHSDDAAPVASAGWLRVCGDFHFGVRFAAVEGRLDADALRAHTDDPALYSSYDEMAAAQADGQYRQEAAEASRRRARHGEIFAAQNRLT